MQALETGKDKIKKICDVIRKDTLEPALKEAEIILKEAREEAEAILEKARKKITRMQKDAEDDQQKKEAAFRSNLEQAYRQMIEMLKQEIEEKLINNSLDALIAKQMTDPNLLSKLIIAVIKAIEKEGLEADLSVVVPASVPAKEVNALIMKDVLERLKEKSVILGPISGGIEVKLHQKKMTIDITDQALTDMVREYIRKDLRDLLFASNA